MNCIYYTLLIKHKKNELETFMLNSNNLILLKNIIYNIIYTLIYKVIILAIDKSNSYRIVRFLFLTFLTTRDVKCVSMVLSNVYSII